VTGVLVKCPRCGTEFQVPPDEGPRPSYDRPHDRPVDRPEGLQNLPAAPRRDADIDRPSYDRPGFDRPAGHDEDAPPRIGPAGQADLSGNPPLDIGESMGAAQRVWGQFLGPAIGFIILTFLVNMALSIGSAVMQSALIPAIGPFAATQLINFVVAIFIQAPMGAGFAYAGVRLLRRERWQFADFFSGFTQYGNIVLLNIVMYFVTLIIFMPLVIAAVLIILSMNPGGIPPRLQAALPVQISQDVLPIIAGVAVFLFLAGIYLFIRWTWATLLIIDQRMGAFDALGTSWKITNGKVLGLIGLGFMLSLIALLGLLACGIGLLFAIPYIILCQSAAYLSMTGQLSRGMPPSRRDDYGRREDHGRRDDYGQDYSRRDVPPRDY
jgi:hypothetical protein